MIGRYIATSLAVSAACRSLKTCGYSQIGMCRRTRQAGLAQRGVFARIFSFRNLTPTIITFLSKRTPCYSNKTNRPREMERAC
jgi:hypothetical protein